MYFPPLVLTCLLSLLLALVYHCRERFTDLVCVDYVLPCNHSDPSFFQPACTYSDLSYMYVWLAGLDLFCSFICWICLFALPAADCTPACQATGLSRLLSHLLCLRCSLFCAWVPVHTSYSGGSLKPWLELLQDVPLFPTENKNKKFEIQTFFFPTFSRAKKLR